MKFLCKAEDTAHAFFFSILDGLFFFCFLWDLNGECIHLAGKLPKLGSVMIWCGNQQSQPVTHLRNREGQIPLQLSWWLQFRENEKGWVNVSV